MARSKKDNDLLKALGKKIKEQRQIKGVSQQELASLCDFEKSNMSRLEAGNTNPAYLTLVKISNALKIDVSKLIQENKPLSTKE